MQEEEPNAPKDTVEPRRPRPLVRRVVRWCVLALLLPIVLVLLIRVALYIPAVQDVVRGRAVAFLHQKLGTEVALEGFALRFPLGVSVKGLHVEDRSGDTLIRAGELKARVSLSGLLESRIHLTDLSLSDTRAHLAQDADSTFNFQFIVDAFVSDSAVVEEPSEGKGWLFSVDGVELTVEHPCFTTERWHRPLLTWHLR